jgi:hypothetical protein
VPLGVLRTVGHGRLPHQVSTAGPDALVHGAPVALTLGALVACTVEADEKERVWDADDPGAEVVAAVCMLAATGRVRAAVGAFALEERRARTGVIVWRMDMVDVCGDVYSDQGVLSCR